MTEPVYLQSPLLLSLGFSKHGFTLRQGGVSQAPYDSWNFSPSTGDSAAHVEANYQRLAQELGCPRGAISSVHQVHSSRVLQVDDYPQGCSHEQADGLWTSSPQQVVAIKTADCVPILIADPNCGAVAAVHAGWRGVVSGIMGRALSQICEAFPEAQPHVAIGPHICADCFQVGPEVAEQFPSSHRADPSTQGRFLVDLVAALRQQARGLGLSPSHFDVVPGCTLHDPQERFFSHRRYHGRTGRMLNFICPARSD